MNVNNTLVLDAVTKRFENPPTLALDQISATIYPGEITGLVGPDGAGKTTLLRLMTGLLSLSAGRLTGRGLHFEQLGYMPQKFGLYEDLTVMENLTLYADVKQLPRIEQPAIFKKMLRFTDLTHFVDRRAGQLSGGMKQKLGLACALLKKPELLLLDEPSVGVDPISRRELWELVTTIAQDGVSVIWATSYLDEAEKCARVLLLNEGKLLFYGPPTDLTNTLQNRVYLSNVIPQNKRTLLSTIMQRSEILDSTIQGDRLRVILQKNVAIPTDLYLSPTTPRFEDAFIDKLDGKYLRISQLTSHVREKSDNGTAIVAEQLTKYFGDFRATHNISFSIPRGEIFGLLGPNGAGKSTTFKMLCGLLQPSHGKALIAGHDLRTAPATARERLGYMAQKFSLYGNLSVEQNLSFFSGIYGLTAAYRQHRIKEMIALFELERYRRVNADQLPLGYKQRLALACAIMHEPDVLFLDEPTSGVDPLTRREFWVHINGMVQKGITIMVTTHFMDEAEYCDRIALIYHGENIAMDTPDNLKNKIRSHHLPNPTLEDAFIELIRAREKERV